MIIPTLIVADDDPGIRKFIRNVAEELGFKVGEAGSGVEYRELYGDVHADIIILDITMPEEHGTQLFDFIFEHHSNTKIVIITGHSEPYLTGAVKMGAKKGLNMLGGLKKPINLDDLEGMLKKALPSSN